MTRKRHSKTYPRTLARTRTKGAINKTSTAKNYNLNQRTEAGEAETRALPGTERFQRYVLSGVCPFCEAGPFQILASHTTRAHATDRYKLREMAGLTYTASITSPELHAVIAERSRKNMDTEKLHAIKEGLRRSRGIEKRRLSPAAQAQNLEKLKLAHTRENWSKVGRIVSDRYAEETEERDTQIIEAYETGAMLRDIAAQFGVNPATIRETLKRRGVYKKDGRARYMATKKGNTPSGFKLGQQINQERHAERDAQMRTAYESGVPLEEISRTFGVSMRGVRPSLRRVGCAVPDGRSSR